MPAHHILLDVDTGVDDAMAIMFAIRHPEIDVRAITCVDGNVPLPRVVEHTCRVLDALGAPQQIPVAAGASRPLLESPRDAAHAHGADGLAGIELPASERPVSELHAIEVIRRAIEESAQPLTLVALAPLTNVALLLRMYPEVAAQLEGIVLMGGSAAVGNATPVAEFNVWHDPEAARIVFESELPVRMYGLDVFDRVGLDEAAVAHLTASTDPLTTALGELLGFWLRDEDGVPGGPEVARIGDAGAVCSLVAPELMDIRSLPVRVETSAGPARGQTIVDRRRGPGEDAEHGLAEIGRRIDVVLAAQEEAVARLFLETVAAEV
ncbi:nucleoside hydrolase [Brachybacterium endophyticum]|uniref:Nucleoside hydrolase n=2 Tax=Brachybacterium endophyticum TaxID=2182385 RepID=A0A2U2RGH7_9MICO|nr:nucleoside hydrolase [Brachybacterium endophyticum]